MKGSIYKKILAILLAISMSVTVAPSAIFASDIGYGPEIKNDTAQDTGNGTVSDDIPLGDPEDPLPEGISGNIGAELTEEQGAEEINAREVIQTYVPLKEGEDQDQTDGAKISYRFKPSTSGYYHLSCSSKNGRKFNLYTEGTFYKNTDSGTEEYWNGGWSSDPSEKTERVMWLNSEEQYIFSCQAASYNATTTYDFTLNIRPVNITGIEVEADPQNASFDFLDYTGMQVRILFEDGTSVLSDARNGNYCWVEALEWSPAHESSEGMNSEVSLVRIDDTDWDQTQKFQELGSGEHTAVLRISKWGTPGDGYDFQINFTKKDNLYESMEITPKRTIYYTGCSKNYEDGDYLSGDYISDGMHITLYRKDGTTDSYDYWSNLPYANLYGEYGLKLDDFSGKYHDIDAFISGGGTVGEQTVEASYCGMTASYTVTLKENPYQSIEIEQQPDKTQYLHNSQSEYLDLRGLVIHAYKNDTEYDTFDYNDYMDYQQDPGTLTEEQYNIMSSWNLFHYTLGGHDSIGYLESGSHPVKIFFMGYRASYDIEVKDQLAKSLTILQGPTDRIYYSGYETDLDLEGLEIQVEDLEGNISKYKYGYGSSDGTSEYGEWWEVNDHLIRSSDIDWNRPGDYTATLSYMGAEASFEVGLLENPIKTFQITKMPDKKIHYQYENIDLQGMEYQIAYTNGETFTGKCEQYSTPQFTYNEKQFPLIYQWKETDNGKPVLGKNALVISALGVMANTDAITVKADPVKSIEVLKNPDKMKYVSDRDSQIDLYGMELSIVYTDDAVEKITFTEHTDKLEVENDCGGIITAYVSFYDGNRELNIEYRNERCTIMLPQPDWSAENSVKMADEKNYPTALTKEQPYRVYSFRPSATKTYHFFSSGTVDNYVELYEGNDRIDSNDDGGENVNFLLSSELKADTDYYFIVSHCGFGNAGDFTCYLSSTVSSLSELEVTDLQVTKAPQDTWYDFETSPILADSLSLEGTEYKIIYSNGWERTEKIDAYGSETEIDGKTLSVRWKNTTENEYGDSYVDQDKENALIYTYGEKTSELPVKFNVPSPVASISIVSSPWKDWKPYQYQVNEGIWPTGPASVKIQYNDGRSEETVTWETGDERYHRHNGYLISADLKIYGDIQPGTDNAVVVSYMGSSIEVPITIIENPVGSVQILQKPEKTKYYPFEQSVDLYGMKVQITYKNGKTQTAEVSEHTDMITVTDTEGYNGKLTSTIGYGEEHARIVSISYMGYSLELLSDVERIFTAEDSMGLTEAEQKQIILNEGPSYQIFSFTPSESGTYRFSWNDKESGYQNNIRIYNATNNELTGSRENDLDYEMVKGRMYYIVLINESGAEQSIICSISRQADTPKEDIHEIYLPVEGPSAGNALPDLTDKESDHYYVSSCTWMNDEGDDGIADYGKKHQFTAVLRAKNAYQFTSATVVRVNGKEITAKSVGSDGSLTIYYTFPSYTLFQVTIPQAEGYTLDESRNALPGRAEHGGTYTFCYTKDAGNSSNSKLIVKAGDTVLNPSGDGTYVIENITENITVTTKQDDISAGSDESKLTLHDRSESALDVLIGKRNAKLADNENGEKTLPSLKSYPDDNDRYDQFFFGWYQDRDQDINGRGTRFTSQSILENPQYSLYARWGKGIFSYILNYKSVNCKILSIDESDKIKVQIGDAAARLRRASYSALAERNARASEDGSILEIPEKIDWNDNDDLKDLGIEFSDCSVTAIADKAFSGDPTIKQVKLPETLEKIGENAFEGCIGLQEVTIPASVDTVPEGAFQGCTSLTRVRLEEGVSKIDASAFKGCTNLQTIVLPDTIETVHEEAFDKYGEIDLVCSSDKKDSPVIKAVENITGAEAVTIDVKIDHPSEQMQFTYGDPAKTFTASVYVDGKSDKDRKITWIYPDTQAYRFSINEEKNSLTVTPVQVTADGEQVTIQAVDERSGNHKDVILSTKAKDTGNSGNGNNSGVPSVSPTDTPSVTPTDTPSARPTDTPTGTPSVTPVPSNTPAPPETITPVPQPKASQVLKSRYDSKGKRLKTTAGSRLTQVITGAKTNITFKSSNTKIAKVGRTTGVIRFVGVGKVVITAKAAESKEYRAASKKTTFYVIPKTAKVRALRSNKKGQVTVKGRNGAKDNDGYQIQYKQNGKTRKVIVKGKRSVTKTFKNLRSGKTFKVRMRAYKKVGNVTYYGKYGKWKTLKRVK